MSNKISYKLYKTHLTTLLITKIYKLLNINYEWIDFILATDELWYLKKIHISPKLSPKKIIYQKALGLDRFKQPPAVKLQKGLW